MSERPIAVDLFSGAGGFAEGLLAAGVRVAVAVEKDKSAAFTNAFNHPETLVICDDIKKISAATLTSAVCRSVGKKRIDVIVGGPPCQGFSCAGRKDASDRRNLLVWDFVRLVEECKPRWFVFENVPDIARVGQGRLLDRLVHRFRSAGYSLNVSGRHYSDSGYTFPICDSAKVGVPQHRNRLILIGAMDESPVPNWATEVLAQSADYVSVYDAISDLAFLKAGFECHAYRRPARSIYQKERRGFSIGLFNHLASNHSVTTIEMLSHIRPGGGTSTVPVHLRSGKQRRARLARHLPSLAVVGLQDDFVHYSQDRVPTVRELARLQSFDDNFVFFGPRTANGRSRHREVPQYTQVGNAVPPLVGKSIGSVILSRSGFQDKDLRNIKDRPNRQAELSASSSFCGYSVSERLATTVRLYDAEGMRIRCPVGISAAPIKIVGTPKQWDFRKYG